MVKDVDPAALTRLLELQEEDSAIRLLEHRRATLPEAQRLAELEERLSELEADMAIAGKQREELDRAQGRLEGEIGMQNQKVEREEQRMYSGAISNPKELNALRAEVEMLRKKTSGLEDELLEVMVQREHSEETLNALTSEHSEVNGRAEELGRTVTALTSEIDAELRTHSDGRKEAAGAIPDDLLQLYEQLREQKGGVGAAELRAGACQGCHTQLPAREVERLKAEGGLQRCENCRRILVVT